MGFVDYLRMLMGWWSDVPAVPTPRLAGCTIRSTQAGVTITSTQAGATIRQTQAGITIED